MAPAHPLHDLLAGLADGTIGRPGEGTDDLAATLREGGHPDLPDGAVAEAIVSYADTAAVEVAEHLAPFVMGHSTVPPDPQLDAAMEVRDGLELLATAPHADPLDGPLLADPGPALDGPGTTVADHDTGAGAGTDLDFGTGAAADAVAAGASEPPSEPLAAELAGPEPLEPTALPDPDPADGPGLIDLFATEPEDDADGGDGYGGLNGG